MRITQLNETDYDTDLTYIDELQKVTVDDLNAQFIDTIMPWENVNEISELMKFLILRWLDRIHDLCLIKKRCWALLLIVNQLTINQFFVYYALQLHIAWSDVMKLLPYTTRETTVDDDREILERLKTAVSAIPEKVFYDSGKAF